MRKRAVAVAVLAAAVFAAPSGARAGAFYDGRKLAEDCKQPDGSYSEGLCLGYVQGVADAIQVRAERRPDGTYEGLSPGGFRSCVPAAATAAQLEAIVQKWLAGHPQTWHLGAGSLVGKALADAFPCKS